MSTKSKSSSNIMKRYKPEDVHDIGPFRESAPGEMVETPKGEYVLYTDHLKAMQAKNEHIKDLAACLETRGQ